MERRRASGLPVHVASGPQSLSSRYRPGTKALVALNLAALLLLNLGYARRHGAVTPPPVTGVPALEVQHVRSGPFPKVLHQMHASLSRLSALEVLLSERCRRVNSDFEYRFWTDESIDAFIAQHYAADHGWWSSMAPPIKKADTSRYFLLHFYGGAYVDLDVDCIRPISSVACACYPHLPGFSPPLTDHSRRAHSLGRGPPQRHRMVGWLPGTVPNHVGCRQRVLAGHG